VLTVTTTQDEADAGDPRNVRLQRHGDHVMELVLDRPEALNAVSTAMARDLAAATRRIAEDRTVRAVVGLPEVSVGVIPGGGGTQLLTRRIGWSRAADLVFTARRLTAAEALAHGCVDRVVPAGEARDSALELAATIAAHSPVGLRQAKKAMRLGLDVDLATGLEVEDGAWRATAFSPDRAEGVRAFAEKRRPQWPGE
jgi:enoyl-CoA hydratase/carnithine racemase